MYVGLFGYVDGASASITNVGLEDVTVTGAARTGALVGQAWSGATVSNVYVVGGTVSGTTGVGGLIGWRGSGTTANAYTRVTVTGSGNSVGGFVGAHLSTTTLANVYSTGDVTASDYVGGLIGETSTTSNVTNLAFTTSSVTATTGSPSARGRFIGRSYANVTNSRFYNVGNPTSCAGTVVSGSTAGCTGQNSVSYFKDTANVPLSSWDFVDTWDIDASTNDGYPTLSWQTPPDTTAPTLTSVSVSPGNTSATFSWTSDEASSSIVEYGLTNSLGTTSTESDTSPRVTGHSKLISDLVSCSTYYYRVKSTDASSNSGTGSISTFSTTGCTGSASISSQSTSALITTGAGGSATLSNNDESTTLSIPAGYNGTAAYFQIKQLDKTSVLATTSTPSTFTAVGNLVFDLKALTAVNTSVTSFSQPITVSMQYKSADVASLSVQSLWIYRYDGSSWNALTGCTVTSSTNTVTCTTSNFSTFALFGQTALASGNSSSTLPDYAGFSCDAQAPTYAPNLFQLDSFDSSVTLHFSPVLGSDRYYIKYGVTPYANQHAVSFINSDASGALTYTVNNLQKNTKYYFTVRAGNGCATGAWSHVMHSSTKLGMNISSLLHYRSAYVESKMQKTSEKLCIHNVIYGDSLWSIASKRYGSGKRYVEIKNSNKLLTNTIRVGMKLSIVCE